MAMDGSGAWKIPIDRSGLLVCEMLGVLMVQCIHNATTGAARTPNMIEKSRNNRAIVVVC
eukprot:642303-Amphidinium_carterae.1